MSQRREPKGASGGGRFAPDTRGKTPPSSGPDAPSLGLVVNQAQPATVAELYARWRQDNPDGDVFMLEDEHGTTSWYRDGDHKLHRETGPARIYPDGTTEWWQCGMLHRETGPARIYPDGRSEWWKDGVLVPDPTGDQDK